MNAWTIAVDADRDANDDSPEFNRYERITHRHDGHCPVRAHASRLRARMRSQGRSRRGKGALINGAHRRRRHSSRPSPVM